MALFPVILRQAHEDGDVVFFCGAGVSMPSGLPSFKGLVEEVITRLAPSKRRAPLPWKAFEEKRFDEVLDILERHTGGGYGKEVREKVCEILQEELDKKTLNIDAHVSLCRLASLGKPAGRLITTNFDPLFEKAQDRLRRKSTIKHKTPIEVAPALSPPKPEGWSKLVYLHGKLNHEIDDKNLVLTTADFGKAYLLDGWARRVVIELFRHFHVVFIGYSIEDPTMRYLVSALAAAREDNEHFKEAYALVPFGGKDDPGLQEDALEAWVIKGVFPLAYENSEDTHQELWQEIKDWADDHSGGLDSKLQKVTRYGRSSPVDTPDEAITELCWALQDESIARLTANLEGEEQLNPAWIPVLQENGLLSLPVGKDEKNKDIKVPLVSMRIPDHQNLHGATAELGRWISSHLNSREAIDWATSQGGVLHQSMRRQIIRELGNNSEIEGGYRKIWRVLGSDNYAHALSAKNIRFNPNHPRLSPDATGALLDFLERLRPIPVFSIKPDYYREAEEYDPEIPTSICVIKIHLVGIESDFDVERFRKRATDWSGALASIADEITSLLKEAMDWQKEFGMASGEMDYTYSEFRSINPHEQNKYAKTWTQLIQLTRESFNALNDLDPLAAERLVNRWHGIDYPIFRRLVLYAATGGNND